MATDQTTAPLDLDAIRARADGFVENPFMLDHRVLQLAQVDVPALLAEVERLRAEVAARLNEEDYDPAPIILEYDRMAAQRDAYRDVVEKARAMVAYLRALHVKPGDGIAPRESQELIAAVDSLPSERSTTDGNG